MSCTSSLQIFIIFISTEHPFNISLYQTFRYQELACLRRHDSFLIFLRMAHFSSLHPSPTLQCCCPMLVLVSTTDIYWSNCLAYVVLEYRVGEVLISEGRCGETDANGPMCGWKFGIDHELLTPSRISLL